MSKPQLRSASLCDNKGLMHINENVFSCVKSQLEIEISHTLERVWQRADILLKHSIFDRERTLRIEACRFVVDSADLSATSSKLLTTNTLSLSLFLFLFEREAEGTTNFKKRNV